MSVSASRKPEPTYYQGHLRGLFVYYLIRHERFEQIVTNLRPLWQRAVANSYDPGRLQRLPFEALPLSDSRLRAYHDALIQAVMRQLRCNIDGRPAGWVCKAVHGAVTGGLVMILPSPATSVIVGDLRMPVFNIGGAGVGAKINGKPFGDLVDIEPEENPNDQFISPTLCAFDSWDQLRSEAHQQLDALIDELKRRVSAETASWKAVYRKGHMTRIHSTMPLLLDWLVARESLWANHRPAAHALLRELGLDQPGKVRKSR